MKIPYRTADKKKALLEKIELLEKKLTDYTTPPCKDTDFIYENSCSYSLLLLNFLIFVTVTFILQKSYDSNPAPNYGCMNFNWITKYIDSSNTQNLVTHQIILWIVLLSIFYSGKTCYNIWYSDYYSNKIIVEKLLNINHTLSWSKGDTFYKLQTLKSSILTKEEISDIEFDNILNWLNILILKFLN